MLVNESKQLEIKAVMKLKMDQIQLYITVKIINQSELSNVLSMQFKD